MGTTRFTETLGMLQPRALGFLNRVVALVSASDYYICKRCMTCKWWSWIQRDACITMLNVVLNPDSPSALQANRKVRSGEYNTKFWYKLGSGEYSTTVPPRNFGGTIWSTDVAIISPVLGFLTGICNHWTGLLDWTTGLDYWTGLDWTGLPYHKPGSFTHHTYLAHLSHFPGCLNKVCGCNT